MFKKKCMTKEEEIHEIIIRLSGYAPEEMDKIVTLAKQYRTWSQKVRDFSSEQAPEEEEPEE